MEGRRAALMAIAGVKAKWRLTVATVVAALIGSAALYGLSKPVKNGCVMTYMYPTYIPISFTNDALPGRYGLYLYHEGWRKIDFEEHLKKLSGVPVLFIPGNAGSYKQVRSLAAESDRAYKAGPPDPSFYREASLLPEELDSNKDLKNHQLTGEYENKLDWFAVDLEGEHSAMDGRILEEHTEYVVYAIHRILDLYKESQEAREKEGLVTSAKLPRNVILVGHSMGGFVARATAVHQNLRKSAVETILTLSSPHQSPPLALQPSLGHYFSRVNQEWKRGYGIQTTKAGNYLSEPLLSRVVVVSISGGYKDYQVRTELEMLDEIVPPTHGFMISSTAMRNVWLSMEHQAILWCNQLVVQVSHTLLSLVDSQTGQTLAGTQQRLSVLARMLRSGLLHDVNWKAQLLPPSPSVLVSTKTSEGSQTHASICPGDWNEDYLERDLYIETSTVTVLAMDGRRRWLDIEKLGSDGKGHFVFVTNLAPCAGVRIHLWPGRKNTNLGLPVCQRVREVTTKMVNIPSGPAPKQVEPGSQTEQASPSAVLMLSPEEMQGYRFLTISVAPRPTVSGRPPPAVSMAVGQFFNPEDGKMGFYPGSMLYSKELYLKEDHPLAYSFTFGVSLGLSPVSVSLKTAGCGIKTSGLPDEEAANLDSNKLCKLRCFPSVALAWDSSSGLHIFPNLYSETIIVDSSPALWNSAPGSQKTVVILLVDPHCSYKASIQVSITTMACRFLLLYSPQVIAFAFAVTCFALMRQAHEWDSTLAMPSLPAAVELNLRAPFPVLLLAVSPILASFFFSLLMSQPLPPFTSFTIVTLLCYILANAIVTVVALVTQVTFQIAAIIYTYMRIRWQSWERNYFLVFLHRFSKLSSNFFCMKVIRILKSNTSLVTTLAAVMVVCLIHPALGLFILLLSHIFCCHNSMCCFVSASRRKEMIDLQSEADHGKRHSANQNESIMDPNFLLGKKPSCGSGSPKKCFGDTQVEIFHYRHGLLVLHLIAALMFVPSLAAWLQRIRMGQKFPWFADSAVCVGVIFHGIFNTKPDSSILFSLPPLLGQEVRPRLIYIFAGFYAYFSGLVLAPYQVLYAIAAIGYISLAGRIIKLRRADTADSRIRVRNHSHRH